MESNSLDSVLSGQAQEPQVTETTQAEEVVQEQVTEVQEATGEQTGTPPEAKQDDPLDRHRKGLEQAASAERKRRQDAEQRAERAEQELRALRQPAPQKATQQNEDAKPQRAQFETEDEWLDARDAWRDREQERQWTAREQERAEQTVRTKAEGVFAEAMKLPGFDMQAFSRLPCPEPMADAILDSDASAQLVHYLTANPAEAYRIAALSATRQVKELARIEDRLVASPVKDEPEAKDRPELPETLTQARDTRGRFQEAKYSGPKPLDAILASK